MLEKQLKISLLQVFSQLTTQRNGFRENSCAVDEQACVFGSCSFNKHPVSPQSQREDRTKLIEEERRSKCYCCVLNQEMAVSEQLHLPFDDTVVTYLLTILLNLPLGRG